MKNAQHSTFHELEWYLPHRSPIILLDEIKAITKDGAQSLTKADSPKLQPYLNAQGRLPAAYALELMAQTVGLWSGEQNARAGQAQVKAGFILSCRQFKVSAPLFDAEGSIACSVKLLMRDGNFASFECKLKQSAGFEASGHLSLFQVPEEQLQEIFRRD